MAVEYGRGLNTTEVRIQTLDGAVTFPIEAVLARYSVKSIIRIPEADFPESVACGDTLTHFGLPIKEDPDWSRVLAMKITQNGWFDENNVSEELPVMTFDGAWLVEVVECRQQMRYEEIDQVNFQRTIGAVTNVTALREMILKRYSQVLIGQTPEQILNQGVSVRKLKFVEPIQAF